MIKLANKMPTTVILLIFSCLSAACGLGVAAGGVWMILRFKDTASFINSFLILVGSLLLAAIIRMFADIGQMIFDIRGDLQDSFRQVNELNQRLSQELRNQLQLQADALNRDIRDIIDRLEKNVNGANELGQKLTAIKDSFNQMNCDSRDMNQNIRQIKVFFEQIERHLDLRR